MEEGIEPEEIKILSNSEDIEQLYKDLLKSAMSEISLIVSTHNALFRQQKIGIIEFIKKAAIERNVKVNLIIPNYKKQNQNPLASTTRSEEITSYKLTEIEELEAASNNIHVRKHLPSINQTSKIKSTILLVDRQYTLFIDLKDDLKESFNDLILPRSPIVNLALNHIVSYLIPFGDKRIYTDS